MELSYITYWGVLHLFLLTEHTKDKNVYLTDQGDDIDILKINSYSTLRAGIIHTLYILLILIYIYLIHTYVYLIYLIKSYLYFIYPVPSTFQTIKCYSNQCKREYINEYIMNEWMKL